MKNFYGYLEVVKLLLENSADANIRDKAGKTALTYAFKNGYQEIIELPKSYGAKE